MLAVRMLPSDNRHICPALDVNFGFGEYGRVVFDAYIANVNEMSNVLEREKEKSCVIVCLGVEYCPAVLILKAMFRIFVAELCSCLPR